MKPRRLSLPDDLRGENAAELTDSLLAHLQRQFYPDDRQLFHRDRRLLLKAITWPAAWLREKGFNDPTIMPPDDYRALIMDRINEVKRHGDYQKYRLYFPGYLLKCIQNWFLHQGDSYYDRLKSTRNLADIALARVQRLASPTPPPIPVVDILATAHSLIKKQKSSKRANATKTTPQLSLF